MTRQMPPFMGTCTDPKDESLREQVKLITAVVMPVISDWWFRVCRTSSHKENLAVSNLPPSGQQNAGLKIKLTVKLDWIARSLISHNIK